MPRAFTAADVVQSNSGNIPIASAVIDPGVGLTSPAAEGNSGIAVVYAGGSGGDPPEQWDMVADGGQAALWVVGIGCRVCLAASEQDWEFRAFGGLATSWAWVAEEWTNISFAPLLGTAGVDTAANPASMTLGPTASWDATDYAVGIAAVLISNGTAGGSVWPSVSWSDGFVETDVLTQGTGAAVADHQLRIARRYGTDAETGAWQTTATFTGAMTNKSGFGALAVFRAEYREGEV
jgi:hypothetical protein